MMNALYYWSLILLNILLLMKYKCYNEQDEVRTLLEELIMTLVYLMVRFLGLQFFWGYSLIG